MQILSTFRFKCQRVAGAGTATRSNSRKFLLLLGLQDGEARDVVEEDDCGESERTKKSLIKAGTCQRPQTRTPFSGRTDRKSFPPSRGQAHVYVVVGRSQNPAIPPVSVSRDYVRGKELRGYRFGFLNTQDHPINNSNNKAHRHFHPGGLQGEQGPWMDGLLGIRTVTRKSSKSRSRARCNHVWGDSEPPPLNYRLVYDPIWLPKDMDCDDCIQIGIHHFQCPAVGTSPLGNHRLVVPRKTSCCSFHINSSFRFLLETPKGCLSTPL